jgi:biotin operon repressor
MSEINRRRYRVTPEEFVVAWQTSTSAQEVADKLKMPKANVLARACSYRKAGVQLKRMKRASGRRLNVERLNSLS